MGAPETLILSLSGAPLLSEAAMPETYHKETFDAFMIFFRNGGKKIYEEFSINRKVPLKQVMNAMIEASYNNLCQAILAKAILLGEIEPVPPTRIVPLRYKEFTVDKLMGLMSQDLTSSSSGDAYSIWKMKRKKKS
jgi:hypothetical protein